MKKMFLFSALLIGLVGCSTSQSCKDDASCACEKIEAYYRVLAEDTWYGFSRTKFDFNGRTGWIVRPNVTPAEGKPWTWTMQWAEAFVDRTGVLDLLRQGYHHVTLELFDTRMDEKGLAAAADFQKFLVEKLGFAPQANLVGMSWGGFFSIRYANAYPQNVRKIYLDAPLLSFANFTHDIGPWKASKSADWASDPRMPVNMAESLAKAKISILLLYGGEDQTVLPKFNCEPFAQRFKAAGGDIKIDKRGGFGHHPHGLDPDKTSPICTFFKAP